MFSSQHKDSQEEKEQICVENLKKAYEAKDIIGEAESLEKLGHIYLEKGKLLHNGMDYVTAAALYNAALARYKVCPQECDKFKQAKSIECLKLYIVDIEKTYIIQELKNIQVSSRQFYEKKIIERKETLENFRSQCDMEMQEIIQRFPAYEYENNLEEKFSLERKRSIAIRELYEKISENMKKTTKQLFSECLANVGKVPCKYALIAMGSLATDTITPYSDLELAILLEEGKDTEANKQFFRNVVYLMYIRVVNYGETILPTVQIKSLAKPENEHESWFQDFVTPRGFSFDGQVPWASKTPLGRKATINRPAIELMRTPKSMAQLHHQEVTQQTVGYNLIYALLNVVLISGNEKLITDYKSEVKIILNKTITQDNTSLNELSNLFSGNQPQTVRKTLSFIRLSEILENFKPGNPFDGKVKFDVKKELYRLPSMITTVFSLLYDIAENNSWKILEEMGKKNVIQKENMLHLQTIISIAAEIRLKTYLFYGKQKEETTGLPRFNGVLKGKDFSSFRIEGVTMIARFYSTIIPLKENFQTIFLQIGSLNYNLDTFIFHNILYKNERQLKEEFSSNFLDYEKTINLIESRMHLWKDDYEKTDIPSSLDNLAEAYLELDKFEKAVIYNEQSLKMRKQLYGENSAHPDIARSLSHLATVFNRLGKFEKAITYNQRSLRMLRQFYGKKIVIRPMAPLLNNLGLNFYNMQNYEMAVASHEISLKMKKKIYGENSTNAAIATSLDNLAVAFKSLGNIKKALTYHKQSLKMRKQIFGKNSAHPSIATSLNHLAEIFRRQRIFEKAVTYQKQSLQMYRQIYVKNRPHSTIASTLNDLAMSFHGLQNYEEAVIYFKKSLQMDRQIYGEKSVQPSTADSLNNLGETFRKLKIFEKALTCHIQSLKIYRQTFGENSPNRKIANSLSNLGEVFRSMGNFENVIIYHEQALQMWRKIYIENDTHPEIANLLHSLGLAFYKFGNYERAVTYLEQSHQILINIHGEKSTHPDIASTKSHLALALDKLGPT